MPTLFWNAGEKRGYTRPRYSRLPQDRSGPGKSLGLRHHYNFPSEHATFLCCHGFLWSTTSCCGIESGNARAPSWDEFHDIERRLELVVIAATQMTDKQLGRKTTGLLGSDLFSEEVSTLGSGGKVSMNLGRGGATFGTYVVPCRTIGLIGHDSIEGKWEAPKITPRGRQMYSIRSHALCKQPSCELDTRGRFHRRGNDYSECCSILSRDSRSG